MKTTFAPSHSHLLALILLALPLLTHNRIPDDPPAKHGRGRRGSKDHPSFLEPQLNPRNSGYAGCYEKGRAITEAAGLIYLHGPNVVTANEVRA